MKIAEKNTSRKKSEIEKSLQLGMLLHRQTFVTASNAGGGDMEHRLALSRGDDCSALIALNKAARNQNKEEALARLDDVKNDLIKFEKLDPEKYK